METTDRCYAKLSNSQWKFFKADPQQAASISYDDGDWPTVIVPHDWAITGPFDRSNDEQHIMVIEDGEKKVTHHTGRTGGLPHVGIGWYRKRFTLKLRDYAAAGGTLIRHPLSGIKDPEVVIYADRLQFVFYSLNE